MSALISNAPISESDKRLVEQLYDKYQRLMLYIANQLLGDFALAEDAVSESLIKIIRHREKLRDVSSHQIRPYIVNIVRTTSLNLIKQRASCSHVLEDILEEVPDNSICVLDDFVTQEGYDALVKAFRSLPDTLKDVAYLYLVHELSHEEISQMLRISVSASKKRLSRARMVIKKFLGGDNDEK